MVKKQHVTLHGGMHEKAHADISQFDQIQLAKGTRFELEHTNDKSVAQQIAMDHLTEDPRYYDRLSQMEARAKRNKTRLPRYGEVHREQVANGRATIVIRAIFGQRKGDHYQARVLLGTGAPSDSGKEPLLWHDDFYVDASPDDALKTAIAMAKAWARSPEGKRRIATSGAVVGKIGSKAKANPEEMAMSNTADGEYQENPVMYEADKELDRIFSDPEFRASVPEGHWADVKVLFSVLLMNDAHHLALRLEQMMKDGDISRFFVDDRVLARFRPVGTGYTLRPAGKREFVAALKSLQNAMMAPNPLVGMYLIRSEKGYYRGNGMWHKLASKGLVYGGRDHAEASAKHVGGKAEPILENPAEGRAGMRVGRDAVRPNPVKSEVDEHAVTELKLYAENNPSLQRQRESIENNLMLKMWKGTYDHSKAQKLWLYWFDAAARKYVDEFQGKSERIDSVFAKATREQAAREFADEMRPELEERIKSGERPKVAGKPVKLPRKPKENPVKSKEFGGKPSFICPSKPPLKKGTLRSVARRKLPPELFALPETRALPIHDMGHAKAAIGRLNMMWNRKSITAAQYREAFKNIAAAFKCFGLELHTEPKVPLEGSAKHGTGMRAVKASGKKAPKAPRKAGSRSRASTLADPKLRSKLIEIEGSEWAETENGALPTSLTLHVEGWKILHDMKLVGSASLTDLNPKLGVIKGAGRTRYRVDPKTGKVKLVKKSATAEKIAVAKRLGLEIA